MIGGGWSKIWVYGWVLGRKGKIYTCVNELCAKYKLMVNYHDNPIAPSGDRRTYPNVMTKEFCHAQADAKRSHYPKPLLINL